MTPREHGQLLELCVRLRQRAQEAERAIDAGDASTVDLEFAFRMAGTARDLAGQIRRRINFELQGQED